MMLTMMMLMMMMIRMLLMMIGMVMNRMSMMIRMMMMMMMMIRIMMMMIDSDDDDDDDDDGDDDYKPDDNDDDNYSNDDVDDDDDSDDDDDDDYDDDSDNGSDDDDDNETHAFFPANFRVALSRQAVSMCMRVCFHKVPLCKLHLKIESQNGVIQLLIIEAKGLRSCTDTPCNSFVKVTVVPDKTNTFTQSTPIVESKANPVYNKTITLDLSKAKHSRRIVLTVYCQQTLNGEK
ncbi:unnamed protein product [Echinostoma caproni]|uniref:C2 domain-containing protein n=1 Tax=Echinostoma caproni TaxID=27848 RepID=A0A183AGH2_9TREM|nr:unnamed protein product [Echinostoma caproni]